jgi:peptidoglycan hydrolase-like protein with peptidoglycan-binding domain
MVRALGGLAVAVIALVPAATMVSAAVVSDGASDGAWSVESSSNASSNAWAIQYLLRSANLDLAVDGAFGPETEGQVRQFQETYGLSPDGIVGPLTWATLVQNADERPDGIRALQSRLNANGYGLCIDGSFGPLTEQAVRDAQTAYGLPSDGVVSIDTWEKLAHRLSENEFPAGPQPC